MVEHFVKSVVVAKGIMDDYNYYDYKGIMDDYDYNVNMPRFKHFALAFNPQWGRFALYQETFNDVEFMGLQRGDEILCYRETDDKKVEYGIDKYLTYQKLEQDFVSKQKQH